MRTLLPERGETPQQMRWIAPAGTFPTLGGVTDFGPDVPHPGWLAAARVISSSVLVAEVGAPRTWADVGDEGWAFVRRAVAASGSWTIDTDTDAVDTCAADGRLCAAVDAVLEGPFGDLVAAHRGRVELVDARGGIVRIRLGGTCGSCSLSDWTVRQRLERDLRVAAGSDFSELLVVR